jgi:hypothetical protein
VIGDALAPLGAAADMTPEEVQMYVDYTAKM